MAETIAMPKLSDTMTSGVIVKWHFATGDTVKRGDILCEVETDKATMELENLCCDGTISKLFAKEGESIPVDRPICEISDPLEFTQDIVSQSEPQKQQAPVAQTSSPLAPPEQPNPKELDITPRSLAPTHKPYYAEQELGRTNLGSSRWADPVEFSERHVFENGHFWVGRSPVTGDMIGYDSDMHVLMSSGTRSGKGTSVIINNLCSWAGSVVVLDPKGENASVTAARRGSGSDYCEGIGQDVHVLDPFGEATVADEFRSQYNPLDAIDMDSPRFIDDVNRIISAIITKPEGGKNKFFDLSSQDLLRGVILHVKTDPMFEGRRNLKTVRYMLCHGEEETVEIIRSMPAEEREANNLTKDPCPYNMLWEAMAGNSAGGGVIAGIGKRIQSVKRDAPETYQGIYQNCLTETMFLDSPGIQQVTDKSNFKLSEIKTKENGVSVYLCLSLDDVEHYFKWLRIMITLITSAMIKTKGRPATGKQVLMVLDEFACLQRMKLIEDSVAQLAGYGLKMFFVVQNLGQLKSIYKDNWETFVGNSGLKLFFALNDHFFTMKYISDVIGETEVARVTESRSVAESETASRSDGTSTSIADGQSSSVAEGKTHSHSRGTSQTSTKGKSYSETDGVSETVTDSDTISTSTNATKGESTNYGKNQSTNRQTGRNSGSSYSSGSNSSSGGNSSYGGGGYSYGSNHNYGTSEMFQTSHGTNYGRGTSEGTSSGGGTSKSISLGKSRSKGRSLAKGKSSSISKGITESDAYGVTQNETIGTSFTKTHGTSHTHTRGESTQLSKSHGMTTTKGSNLGLHHRPLLGPNEANIWFSPVDDQLSPHYPGYCLILMSGEFPTAVRKSFYFEDEFFIGWYDPHPDHPDNAPPKFKVDVDILTISDDTALPVQWIYDADDKVAMETHVARVGPLSLGKDPLYRQAFEQISANYPIDVTDDGYYFYVEAPATGILNQQSRSPQAIGLIKSNRRIVHWEGDTNLLGTSSRSRFEQFQQHIAEVVQQLKDAIAERERLEEERRRKAALDAERREREKKEAARRAAEEALRKAEEEEKARRLAEEARLRRMQTIRQLKWAAIILVCVGILVSVLHVVDQKQKEARERERIREEARLQAIEDARIAKEEAEAERQRLAAIETQRLEAIRIENERIAQIEKDIGSYISRFQRAAGIKVTGKFDASLIISIKTFLHNSQVDVEINDQVLTSGDVAEYFHEAKENALDKYGDDELDRHHKASQRALLTCYSAWKEGEIERHMETIANAYSEEQLREVLLPILTYASRRNNYHSNMKRLEKQIAEYRLEPDNAYQGIATLFHDEPVHKLSPEKVFFWLWYHEARWRMIGDDSEDFQYDLSGERFKQYKDALNSGKTILDYLTKDVVYDFDLFYDKY